MASVLVASHSASSVICLSSRNQPSAYLIHRPTKCQSQDISSSHLCNLSQDSSRCCGSWGRRASSSTYRSRQFSFRSDRYPVVRDGEQTHTACPIPARSYRIREPQLPWLFILPKVDLRAPNKMRPDPGLLFLVDSRTLLALVHPLGSTNDLRASVLLDQASIAVVGGYTSLQKEKKSKPRFVFCSCQGSPVFLSSEKLPSPPKQR